MPRGSPPRRPHIGSPEPGDEAGRWSWMQLEAMDLKFRRAMDRARYTSKLKLLRCLLNPSSRAAPASRHTRVGEEAV